VIELLLVTLGVSLGIQAALFLLAAWFRTDKVTDLSYGLTFIALAVLLIGGSVRWLTPATAIALMVVLWGLRLAAYLFYRILRIGRDARFDGVRERFWRFARFWCFQGVAVWIIMLPTTLWFALSGANDGWTGWMAAGALIWLAGLVIETVADAQKFGFKNREGLRSRWPDHGLWRYSRHPNYFGELLCWWGVFVFELPVLGWWALPGAAGPLTITGLLLFVTGIPTLEASAQRKWGDDPAYVAYRLRTNRLIPWPARRARAARA
jgi:steroid 5-alpha reductase family enzyme